MSHPSMPAVGTPADTIGGSRLVRPANMAHREPFAVPDQLNAQERWEFQDLMVHGIVGPGGQVAIGPDREFTALTRDTKQASAGHRSR